jgi:PAS domain S-box-containing protein
MTEDDESARQLSALHDLLARLPCIVYRASGSGEARHLEFVSEACLTVTGRKPSEFGVRGIPRFEDLAAPQERDALAREIDSALEKRRSFRIEYLIATPEGPERWLCDEGRGVFGPMGSLLACEGVVYDVTRAHQAAEEAQRTAASLRLVLESAPLVLFAYDTRGICILSEGQGLAALGVQSGWVVGHRLHRIFHDYPKIIENCERALAGESLVATVEFAGSLYQTHCSPLKNARGEIIGMMGVSVDVSSLRRTEQALLETEGRYRQLVENAYDLVTEVSTDARHVWVSPNYRTVLGYELDELVGRNVLETIHPDDRGPAMEAFARFLQGHEPVEARVRARHKDGSWRSFEATGGSFVTASGERRAVVISRDVTARRVTEAALARSEEQLRQAQKMEAVGRLAGGIAHDFNNLLTAIQGYGDLVLDALTPNDPVRRDIEEIGQAARRASELTGQLLAFSRRQVQQRRVLDLNALVSGLDKMLRRVIGEDVELRTRLDPAAGAVSADPGQLEQVLVNLAVNARDAMPTGGGLSIETAHIDRHAASAAGLPHGVYACLIVRDTGVGMDEETRSHLFEPFFTTKPPGKGTGLGLSTVYGIVQQSGGQILAESSPRAGATFRIYLPEVDRPVEALSSPERAAGGQGNETVLLVEDEDSVRRLVQRVLESAGYCVLEAENPHDALRLCERHPEPIDLMVTDVVMPQMSGRELASQTVALRPEMRVLYVSGYMEEVMAHHGVLEPGIAFLGKPFAPEDLTRKVREVLDGPPRSDPR